MVSLLGPEEFNMSGAGPGGAWVVAGPADACLAAARLLRAKADVVARAAWAVIFCPADLTGVGSAAAVAGVFRPQAPAVVSTGDLQSLALAPLVQSLWLLPILPPCLGLEEPQRHGWGLWGLPRCGHDNITHTLIHFCKIW